MVSHAANDSLRFFPTGFLRVPKRSSGGGDEVNQGPFSTPKYTVKNPDGSKETRAVDVWWYKFTYRGKEIRESAKTTRKTVATEKKKHRRWELEKAPLGPPTERLNTHLRSVTD